MTPAELLKDIVTNGIALDVFDAEEVFALDKIIYRNADAINTATYGAFFGALQRYLGRQLILSVARIYESNSRYQLRSIPAALKLMREKSDELEIPERPTLVRELVSIGYRAEELESLSNQEITDIVVGYFEVRIPKAVARSEINLESALHAIKTVRDKSVAHHEAVERDSLPKPTYDQLVELTEIAKQFIGMVGLSYLSTAYRCDRGEYLLSADAGCASRCLKRILAKTGALGGADIV